MGISKIGLLFAANVDSVKGRKRETEDAERAQRRSPSGDDAAVVSSSMAQAPEANASEERNRAARIAQLRNQIRSGTYKVNTAQIALALARDIG